MRDFEWSRPGMAIRTGAELQAARKAAAEKFMAIAMQFIPEGYTIEYRKSLSGRCLLKKRIIKAPRPVTRRVLYVFLHECAHARLDHQGRRKPRHVEEMEAEKWAHRRCGSTASPSPAKRRRRPSSSAPLARPARTRTRAAPDTAHVAAGAAPAARHPAHIDYPSGPPPSAPRPRTLSDTHAVEELWNLGWLAPRCSPPVNP